MDTKSKYAKKFHSYNITRQKYDELYECASKIRDHKNEASKYVSDHILQFLELDKFQFMQELINVFKGKLSSCFYIQTYRQLYVDYTNKFDKIKYKMQFFVITGVKREYYKRNTKDHNKGDLKSRRNIKGHNNITKTLTFLARYGNPNTIKYLENKIPQLDPIKDKDKIDFYKVMLGYFETIGFDRLYKLALARRENIIKKNNKPIEYKSLTFSGRTQRKHILRWNKNKKSKVHAFISLSNINRDTFDIPVKYNKAYHKRIKDYEKSSRQYEYNIKFDERKKEVIVMLCIDGIRKIPEAKNDVVGIDVNTKHNLLAVSDGKTYDYDRKLVKEYLKLSRKIDRLKSKSKNEYKTGKRKQRKLDVLNTKISDYEDRLISEVCKELQLKGVHHVVMEDLQNNFGKSFVLDKENDVNYNRKIKFLGIADIKNKFERIARKYDIAVSTVHSHYTSKMCSQCGCIDDRNRKTQENFECIKCGHKDNADHNAALNIKDRVVVTVLRRRMLDKLGNGAYKPKPLKKEEVKDVLLSLRSKSGCKKSDSVVNILHNVVANVNNI